MRPMFLFPATNEIYMRVSRAAGIQDFFRCWFTITKNVAVTTTNICWMNNGWCVVVILDAVEGF